MLAPTIRKSLPALIAAALLLPSGLYAARRPLSRNAPAPVEEKKVEPTEQEKKKAEESQKASSKAAEDEAARPDESVAQAEEEPPKPQVVVPIDESGAVVQQEKKVDAPPPPAVETVYRKQLENKTVVTLRVRPAQPEPGKLTTLLFEFTRILDIPDPLIGDRAPVENAEFIVTFARENGGEPVRYRLNPLRDAGIYGTHFTATEPGLYKLKVEQQVRGKLEIGEVAIATDFRVGFGVPTPPPSEEDVMPGQRTRRGRGRASALRAISERDTAADAVSQVMSELGAEWFQLARKLDDPKTPAEELEKHAKAVAELSGKVTGQVPVSQAVHGKEFNVYAGQLQSALDGIVKQLSDRRKAKESLVKLEQGVCLKCHARFRYQITEDVSKWPKFQPKDVRQNARR